MSTVQQIFGFLQPIIAMTIEILGNLYTKLLYSLNSKNFDKF